jgi:hypothetical protein
MECTVSYFSVHFRSGRYEFARCKGCRTGVIIIFGRLAATVLYLAFLAGSFDLLQKLAIFIASGAIVVAIVVVILIKWALK